KQPKLVKDPCPLSICFSSLGRHRSSLLLAFSRLAKETVRIELNRPRRFRSRRNGGWRWP
ncbi:unnamed protein product, partial [Linum tenue]